ncbi:hypothetical protein QAD02_023412 [Eretmocerus hayati]|uniref:Uncharacterized protein n=1 Tax=Eretmocerus hayati TaxID=131215 RepID=A0ACC2PWW7_9HYME|nr:hypothetical protein QAD02_023412 [Eretmocerus hayati]
MVVAKKFVLRRAFQGEPKLSDMNLVEENLGTLHIGEILIEAEYLSVDPYMQPFSVHLPVGATMVGLQIAKIIESKHSRWPVNRRVIAFVGWRTHTIINPDQSHGFGMIKHDTYFLPPGMENLPPSLALGMLGLTGNAAFFGFTEICEPKYGETLVVSSAAGAVGSHVAQIAKILGLKVIGIAGTEEKCKWLREELALDHVINHKIEDLPKALRKAAPNGIDCYFDTVGGEISSQVIHQMKEKGRVSVCGSTSCYGKGDIWRHDILPKSTVLQPAVIFRSLKVEGFFVTRWGHRWSEGIEKNLAWIREDKLKYKETVIDGFENTFKAFINLMQGKSIGKTIVKV